MERAGSSTLDRIASLLEEIRAYSVLREKTAGHFYLNGREILHFHDDPTGIFADVRLSEGFVRLPVTSAVEQAELLGRIEECLSIIESRAIDRRRKTRRSRR